MIKILEQTHEEKTAMYMKLTKKELVKMLIECNRLLDIKSDLQIESKKDIKCKCKSGYWDGYQKCEIHNK